MKAATTQTLSSDGHHSGYTKVYTAGGYSSSQPLGSVKQAVTQLCNYQKAQNCHTATMRLIL